MLVETTNYYAKAGGVDAVLAQRRRATAIRVQLGLAPGRIYTKVSGDGPDVAWQCVFATRDEFDRDMAARATSADFAAARQQMHTLVERFERYVQAEVPSDAPG